MVLLLFYIFDFFFLGLKECWIRAGTGEITRFISIHTHGRKPNHRTRSAVMKAHILTGCDVTSKIGIRTKTAAIKASPQSYLHNFGKENNSSAEAFLKYLVCVLDKNSPAKSFDKLRYLWYTNKNKSLSELSPASHSLQSHLERSFFVIRNCADLLNENAEPLDPLESGWKEKGCILHGCTLLQDAGRRSTELQVQAKISFCIAAEYYKGTLKNRFFPTDVWGGGGCFTSDS